MPRSLRFCSAFTLLLSALAASAVSQAQTGTWTVLPDGPAGNGRFEDAAFVSPDTGWVVSSSGAVFRTDDAGTSWTSQGTLPAYLRAAAAPNSRHLFIGTLEASAVLFETVDGGATFENITGRITGPRPQGICGLWAVNDSVIYGAGWFAGPAHVIKSTDGGATWTSAPMSAYAGSLVDVYFWDEMRGLAVGGTAGAGPGSSAVVLMTEDGGATWTERHRTAGAGEWAWKIAFPTPEVGYVSVEYHTNRAAGKVLKTTDGGYTWTELPVPSVRSMQGIGFVTEDVGWVSGRGDAAVTADGGMTWTPLPGLSGGVNRFAFFGDSLGYALAGTVSAWRPGGATASDPAAPVAGALSAPYPNPSAGSVTIAYALAAPGTAEIEVFDLLGRRVYRQTVAQGRPDVHTWTWDGRDGSGRHVPAGTYVIRVRTERDASDYVVTRAAP